MTDAGFDPDKRHWQRAIKEFPLLTDVEGKLAYVQPAHRVSLDLTFETSSTGRSAKLRRSFEIARFRAEDRALLEANGLPWREPSELVDLMIDDLRRELLEELREHMPWDGEI